MMQRFLGRRAKYAYFSKIKIDEPSWKTFLSKRLAGITAQNVLNRRYWRVVTFLVNSFSDFFFSLLFLKP
jgi:hypothetical protein